MLVFILSGEGAECIEQIISSVVWFEGADEDYKICVDVLAVCRNLFVEIFLGTAKRKIHPFSIRPSQQYGGLTYGMIKGMPKIIDYMRGRDSHFGWDAVMEAKLDDLLFGLRINVTDDIVSTVINKRTAL